MQKRFIIAMLTTGMLVSTTGSARVINHSDLLKMNAATTETANSLLASSQILDTDELQIDYSGYMSDTNYTVAFCVTKPDQSQTEETLPFALTAGKRVDLGAPQQGTYTLTVMITDVEGTYIQPYFSTAVLSTNQTTKTSACLKDVGGLSQGSEIVGTLTWPPSN